MVDVPAQLPKTQVRLSTLDLSQGGRFEVGSGKHHKNGPRGRFGLIFGANPIKESKSIDHVTNSGRLRSFKLVVLLTERAGSVF